jgi:hypothetical protein
MARRRTFLTAVIASFAVMTSVYGDMMPVSKPDVARRHSPHVCTAAALRQTDLSSSFTWEAVGDLGSPSYALLPEAGAEFEQAAEAQRVHVLTSGAGSLDLCLYALIGLGLCTYVPCAKNLSFSSIPQWYHNGGPFRIGDSHAIGPDCLCSAVVYFVQPACTADDLQPEYHWGMIAPLLRESLFTPTVLSSRGPPLRS